MYVRVVMCSNRECILDIYICDGEVDCVTGEDEQHCNVCHEKPGTDVSTHYCRYHCGHSLTCTCSFFIIKVMLVVVYLTPKLRLLNHNSDRETILEDYVNH